MEQNQINLINYL